MTESRWAWRNVGARGGRSALTIGMLALALSANTIVFSAADSLAFRRVAYRDADRLISVETRASVVAPLAQTPASSPVVKLTCEEMEAFLKKAKVGRQRTIPVGATLPSRATLDDGRLQHDAAIQTTDISAPTYSTPRGTELNFRDSWEFNIAGYELAKLLELNMVPPYVERTVGGVRASVSWWVSDAIMERDRIQKNMKPPDVERWNHEMYAVRMFHELIADMDFNATNTLITNDWRVWMIDFSRAFRVTKALQYPDELSKTDRRLLAKLRGLSRDALQQKLGRWLTRPQIDAVLARRDLIVGIVDKEIAAKGEAAILYDFPRTSEPCGSGLQ